MGMAFPSPISRIVEDERSSASSVGNLVCCEVWVEGIFFASERGIDMGYSPAPRVICIRISLSEEDRHTIAIIDLLTTF